jgi:hypothetical protein
LKEADQLLEQAPGARRIELRLLVRERVRGIGMDLEEDAVGSRRDRRARQRLGELPLAAGRVARAPGSWSEWVMS